MILNRKIWLGLTLVATGGIALAGVTGGEQGGEGGETGATAKQAEGGEGGEGGEAGAAAKAAEGGESGHGGEAGEGGEGGDFPGGTFASALSKVLAGEGGEGGIGLVKGQGTVSVPALNDAQISETVSGNTLRTEHHYAYHFDKAGTGSGWEIQWSKVDPSQCKAEDLEDGECWTSKTVQLPAAKWSVSDGKVCLTPAVSAVTGSGECAEVYLILNKVGLYAADGKLVGKGSDLKAGKAL